MSFLEEFESFEIKLRHKSPLFEDDDTIYHMNGVLYVTKEQLEAIKNEAARRAA